MASRDIASQAQMKAAMKQAIAAAVFRGNALQQRAKAETVRRLGWEYLVDEIGMVIEARDLSTVEEYQGVTRPGRKVPLNGTQRSGVWVVRQQFNALLERRGLW